MRGLCGGFLCSGTLRANFEYRQDNSQGSKPGTARSGNVSLLAKLADSAQDCLPSGMSVRPLMRLPLLTTELASMMPEDLKELLRAFNDQAVKFLVVGAMLSAFTPSREQQGSGIFVRSDEETAKAVFRALAQYGAALGGLTPSDFKDGTNFPNRPTPGTNRHFATHRRCHI